MSQTLQYLTLSTLRNEDCRGYLPEFERQFVLNTTVCTDNGEEEGMCHGDTGAGLVSRADNKLIGLASWGIPCATGKPDGYLRMEPFINWISEKTGIVVE